MRAIAGLTLALLAGCSPAGPMPKFASPNGSALHAHGFNVTPFNAPTDVFPGATSTVPTGVRPQEVTATIALSNGTTIGGIYNRTTQTWSQIAYPGAQSTAANGIASFKRGYLVVGTYKNAGQAGVSGFVYDSTTNAYTTIDAPAGDCAPQACNFTIPRGVIGRSAQYFVVGNYGAATSTTPAGHPFLYDSSDGNGVFEKIPQGTGKTVYGIWLNGKRRIVAGGYTDHQGLHAYLDDVNGTNRRGYLSYDYPNATSTHFAGITGAGDFGNYNVVGDYSLKGSVYGFFLHVQDWKPWPPIVIGKLTANGVSDRDVVGVYKPDGSSARSGYITTLPVQDPP